MYVILHLQAIQSSLKLQLVWMVGMLGMSLSISIAQTLILHLIAINLGGSHKLVVVHFSLKIHSIPHQAVRP